jgi:hypothetical protein
MTSKASSDLQGSALASRRSASEDRLTDRSAAYIGAPDIDAMLSNGTAPDCYVQGRDPQCPLHVDFC